MLYKNSRSMYVSGKLPTYPSPNLTLLALGRMLGFGRGRWAVSQKHTLIQNSTGERKLQTCRENVWISNTKFSSHCVTYKL